MANKVVAAISTTAAVLLAAGVAMEVTGKVFGNTWNGPAWVIDRAYWKMHAEKLQNREGYQEVSQYINNTHDNSLTLEVNAEGKITSIECKNITIQSSKDHADVSELSSISASATSASEEPVVAEVTTDGVKVYKGENAVWAWLKLSTDVASNEGASSENEVEDSEKKILDNTSGGDTEKREINQESTPSEEDENN